MRILFCNYEYPPLGGGGGVINALLAKELARNHDVTVLTSRGQDKPSREILDGIEILRVPVMNRTDASAASIISMACYLPMGWYEGRRHLRQRRYDIINTHFVVPTGPVGQSLANFAAVPNILTVHGGDLYDPSKAISPHRHAVLRALIRRLLIAADCVVGQSANTIENVHNFYLPDLACELIPLGIERPTQRNPGRAEFGFSDTDFLMVTIGRLVGRKANDQLIRMVKDLGRNDVRLIIIGDGPSRASLEELASQLGVSEQVYFAGFAAEKDKEALLQIADLYVSTSQHEGFGLVYLEAMAAGLPIVCYDHGGHTDYLEQGKTGAVVALNQLQDFAEQCRELMQSADLRARTAAENLRRVEAFFIDTCASHYADLFERSIATFKSR
jgi:glycosyltransferase involved in cell wall biosynthesis